MKHLNKIFGLGLATLSASPALAGVSMTTNTNTVSVLNSNTTTDNEQEEKHYACTVTYIGKNCTTNKQAIIARATDCSPKAVHLKLKHFKKDELANKTIEGKLGLKYTMPEHTYAYTACPLSDLTSSDPVWASGMWENNGINEMGVGTTSTLTCTTNPKILKISGEEFIKAGVGEELLTTIITPQAATAKEAMQVAAKAIDQYGAQDANIIMATDQNESWLMEIYSQHQYCAVKMPDDKVMIAGNEFILDSLDELGINASNKDDMCITSPGLLDVPVKVGLAKFKSYAKESEHDVFHLDLFNTYAAEGSSANDGENIFDDGCHMRTWRGYSLFDQVNSLKYSPTVKYEPFLTPKDDKAHVRTDMSIYDVLQVYRDEFDELVDPDGYHFDQQFYDHLLAGDLRTIAVQQTRQVHIMSSDPNKPKWMACSEWYTPDSANYVPYLQFNNAVESFDGEYGYYPDRFEFDENCASVLFRELNKLAWYDRKNYGYPLQEFWRGFETIFIEQMDQVSNDVAKLSEADAKNILTNFNKHVRDTICNQVKKTKDDLLWHIMDQPSKLETFIPLIDLELFAKELGWNNYKFDGKTATFERGGVKCTYTIGEGRIYGQGTLKLSNGASMDLKESVVNNKVYVQADNLNHMIGQYSEIRTINVNDYLDKFNHLVWIIPLACVVAIGAGLAIFFIIRYNQNKNKKSSKSK